MSSRVGRLILAIALSIPMSSGCAGATKGKSKSPWPFAKKDNELPGITTPDMKIVRLRELRKIADKAPPETRDSVANDLAKKIVREKYAAVRGEILLTLAEYPTQTSLAVMKAGLEDESVDVRCAACEAWGKTGGPEAAGHLSRILSSETNVDVRMAAVRSLGLVHDPRAVPALNDALTDRDPAVQFRAMQSLKTLSGLNLGNDVAKWREYAKSTSPQIAPAPVASRFKKWF